MMIIAKLKFCKKCFWRMANCTERDANVSLDGRISVTNIVFCTSDIVKIVSDAIDDGNNSQTTEDNIAYFDDEESEEQWRKNRHQREMFLKKVCILHLKFKSLLICWLFCSK